MRCPTLLDLCPPPHGKTGWPWNEETTQLPHGIPDNFPWPKLTIVTPSLNQGRFLEETIRSVLLQGYPNLEYIVIDGKSSDESKEIIQKYAKWLTYWVSESDKGQSHAINKGFRRSTGDLAAWLNSDDVFLPGALLAVSRQFAMSPEVQMLYGDVNLVDELGGFLEEYRSHDVRPQDGTRLTFIPQPACFWRARIFQEVGYLNESYNQVFDLDYWIRITLRFQVKYFPHFLANFRLHKNAKTQKDEIATASEGLLLNQKLFSDPSSPLRILSFRRNELRHWNERLARAYLSKEAFGDASWFFLRAIFSAPGRPQTLKLLAFALYAFSRSAFTRFLRRRFRDANQDLQHTSSPRFNNRMQITEKPKKERIF